eukprot:4435224-Pleurochrysis_carterae.AAC.1
MEERAAQVNEMYELLENYEVKIPSQDAVKKDNLKETREAFAAKVLEAEGQLEQRMPSMAGTLEKSISNLNEDLMSILTSLHTGDYVNPECDPKTVLDKLHGVSETLSTLGEKAEMYKQMQETFHMQAYEFTQLRDTITQYEAKRELWEKLDAFNEAQFAWKTADFKMLDVEEARAHGRKRAN